MTSQFQRSIFILMVLTLFTIAQLPVVTSACRDVRPPPDDPVVYYRWVRTSGISENTILHPLHSQTDYFSTDTCSPSRTIHFIAELFYVRADPYTSWIEEKEVRYIYPNGMDSGWMGTGETRKITSWGDSYERSSIELGVHEGSYTSIRSNDGPTVYNELIYSVVDAKEFYDIITKNTTYV